MVKIVLYYENMTSATKDFYQFGFYQFLFYFYLHIN